MEKAVRRAEESLRKQQKTADRSRKNAHHGCLSNTLAVCEKSVCENPVPNSRAHSHERSCLGDPPCGIQHWLKLHPI